MNDQTWAHEHATAAALGGLTAEEATRFETEATADAKKAAEGARAIDASLREMFDAYQPGVSFESRTLSKLNDVKVTRPRKSWASAWNPKLSWGVAATVGLGVAGAGLSALTSSGVLPMPSERMPGRLKLDALRG